MPVTVRDFIRTIKRRRDLRDVVHHERLGAREGLYADQPPPVSPEMAGALSGLGIKRLYAHQAHGIEIIRAGRNPVVMTPAASGKSLIYNIPVLESMLDDPDSRALYIFPVKGLEQDQLSAVRTLAAPLDIKRPPDTCDAPKRSGRRAFTPGVAEIYDGDTSSYRRERIRANPPGILLTNPEMLHLSINAFHEKWEPFLRNLRYVVLDEVHTYRGVFGSHMAHVLRRLRRTALCYGSSPVFIACSATIANPVELSRMLTDLDFELVDESAAPQGDRHFIFVNPPPEVSPYTVAAGLFTSSVAAGLKAIAFTRSRRMTELMHARVKKGSPELAPLISSYRGGFLPSERREIEERLFSGALSGVISTSALELGVDIGGLDVCILVGYPGTVASTWQRAGRVGRSGRDSLIVMVGLADALDQYFMRHPSDFFGRTAEAAVLDVHNPVISGSHLLCAAAEMKLGSDDPVYDTAAYSKVLKRLEEDGRMRYWPKGDRWYPKNRSPHREVSIRETGKAYRIVNEEGATIGESGSERVTRELHPGAVYLHRGRQYLVKELDMNVRRALCREADDLDYYTRALSDEESEILRVDDETDLNGATVMLGGLRITGCVTGYIRKKTGSGENLGEYQLNLPPTVFTTTGIWMRVDEGLLDEIGSRGWSVAGSLHALEHAAIAALPLFALCDRMDLGGTSYVFNHELESAAIFIYDGHEGGVGLTQCGFERIRQWFSSTAQLMRECDCEVSCPSCTQDPHCGNNNDPLDKRGALCILASWLG